MKRFPLYIFIVFVHNFHAKCDELSEFALTGDQNLYTTHSETTRPVHVPVFQRIPVDIPNPVPYAVPHYIKVPIPQPYPQYHRIQHPIEVPVYKVVPEVIEKPKLYTVEKPFPIEVEKPFPVETIKKFHIPVPRPYPVHTIIYKHINEDDPAPSPVPKHKLNHHSDRPKKFFLAKLNSRRDRH